VAGGGVGAGDAGWPAALAWPGAAGVGGQDLWSWPRELMPSLVDLAVASASSTTRGISDGRAQRPASTSWQSGSLAARTTVIARCCSSRGQ